jgi:hypothetical protein
MSQCYIPSLYVVHFKGPLNSGEAQSHTLLLLIASGVRADNDDDSSYQSNLLRKTRYEGLEVEACSANEVARYMVSPETAAAGFCAAVRRSSR